MAPIFPSRITRQNPTPPFSIGWFKTASALPVGAGNIPGWGRCILPPPIRCNSPSRATRRTPDWDGENFGLPSGRFPFKYICIPVFRRVEPEIRGVSLVEIESEKPDQFRFYLAFQERENHTFSSFITARPSGLRRKFPPASRYSRGQAASGPPVDSLKCRRTGRRGDT